MFDLKSLITEQVGNMWGWTYITGAFNFTVDVFSAVLQYKVKALQASEKRHALGRDNIHSLLNTMIHIYSVSQTWFFFLQ